MQEARPVVPARASWRIGARINQIVDLLQRRHVLGLPPQRELDLALLEHRVDATETVRLGVRHRVETLQRGLEMRERLGVRPAALRLLGGLDRIVDRLGGVSGLRGLEEVVGELADAVAGIGAVALLHHLADLPV